MADDDEGWALCADWTPASTMKEALKAARARGEGKWKWNKPSGNCTTNAQLRCNAHVDCPHVVRIFSLREEKEEFYLSMKHFHGEISNMKKRKNSPLTYEEEESVAMAADMGGRAGKVHVAMTLKEVQHLKEKGMDPLEAKEADGGLKGVSHAPPMHRTRAIHMYLDVSRHRIHYSGVFRMYPACIVVCITSRPDNTCILQCILLAL